MKEKIVNYATELSPIMHRLMEDSYSVGATMNSLGFPTGSETQMESLVRIGEIGAAFVEGINKSKARQKEIAELTPPIDAKSHYTKLLEAVQTKQRA